MKQKSTDIAIIGGGITGLAIARELHKRFPSRTITIIEKEPAVALHASGRNSGVLHAGFYYTASSLKARFCRDGNAAWKTFCSEKNLPMNPSGKLVLAQSPSEVEQLKELERRGKANGVDVTLVTRTEAQRIEPACETIEIALYSPTTTTLDPTACCQALQKELEGKGVAFLFDTAYHASNGQVITLVTKGEEDHEISLQCGLIINCAGLYADTIARDFGFSQYYTVLPFKGLYLSYEKNTTDLKVNLYPVPDLKMPFLGVHFTITVDGHIKIGPTATPAF